MMKLTPVLLLVFAPLLASAWNFRKSPNKQHLLRRLDEWSFRLKMDRDDDDWCMECEYHSGYSGSTCYEDDKLVIDQCGSGDRQRFLYQETKDGEGRFMPLGSPDLCFTRDGSDITLQDCDDNDDDQIFVGFDWYDSFELSPEDDMDDCLAVEDVDDNEEVVAIDCETASDDDVSLWYVSSAREESIDEDEDDEDEDDDDESSEDTCSEVCLDVYQNDDFIGQYLPVSTNENIRDFYDYRTDNYSFNGDDVVPLKGDTSLVFIHQDADECDLSLVIVHDSKDECSGGEVLMYISGDLEKSVVQDGRDSPSDEYTYDSDSDETECFWKWSWQGGCKKRTDGIAHYWDPDDRTCIYVRPELFEGIDDWQFVPGRSTTGATIDTDDYVDLKLSRQLWICMGEC